jgi:hypothetical protein
MRDGGLQVDLRHGKDVRGVRRGQSAMRVTGVGSSSRKGVSSDGASRISAWRHASGGWLSTRAREGAEECHARLSRGKNGVSEGGGERGPWR